MKFGGLGRIWEEVVVTWFNVLFQNLPGRTEENHERYQGSLCPHAEVQNGYVQKGSRKCCLLSHVFAS